MRRIRAGTPDDLPAITVVRTSVRENHLSVEQMAARGITEETTARAMREGYIACWVAEEDGMIAAFAMADRRQNLLWALFTHPDHQGKGFGTALLAAAEAWLRATGASFAVCDTARHSRAHRFYLKHGWREVAERDEDPEDVVLQKPL